jgi:molybdate transport system substrate-binding protein
MNRTALAALCLAALSVPAQAAELRILSAGAAKPVIAEVIPAFEKASGHKVVIEYMPVGPIMKRLAEGEQRDIVVLSSETMSEAAQKGWTTAASIAGVGTVGMGVGIKEGAPLPDIRSTEAFKKTLLAAKSVALVDPARATSGKHFASLLETLGIAAEMKQKLIIKQGGYAAEAVAKGEAELVVHQITEILPVKGVKLVGPLPAELQKFTVYQAAATTRVRDAAAAKAFLENLNTAEVQALAVSKGFLGR